MDASRPSRVLLVDDERLARARLRRLLEAYPDLEVAGEAASVDEAVAALATEAFDLVFLDVQMPGGPGFELFDRCRVRVPVVFVTAFDQHALRAFEVNALDYLLKPVSPQRLEQCLCRVEAQGRTEATRLFEVGDRVCVTDARGLRFVRLTDLVVIRSAGDYTELLLRDGTSPLCKTTMAQWESRLPQREFHRVHRSSIVRLAAVERLERSGGVPCLHVSDVCEPVPVSRRALAAVEARLRGLGDGC